LMIRQIKKAKKYLERHGGHPDKLWIPSCQQVEVMGSSRYDPDTNTIFGLKVIVTDALPECTVRVGEDGDGPQ